MLMTQPERVLAAGVDSQDAGGGKTRPGRWGVHGGRDKRISLATNPAAVQRLKRAHLQLQFPL